ncbi:triple functional domain protein [Caerostris extrusa]|uniref:Triple functional domain protein n=1 Tax=Caerostris extrusa TaxID=172846 RepID=A0AAV4SD97_CAEEX|nr:triple functional domain protein [Caerostris extrusa]
MEFLTSSSAPELGSLWNPSLRKTLSHPAAAHKSVKLPSAGSGTSLTSKSLKYPGRDKKISSEMMEIKNAAIVPGVHLSEEAVANKFSESQLQSLAVPFMSGNKDIATSKTESGFNSVNSNAPVSLSSSHSLDSSTVSAHLQAKQELSLNKDSDISRRWSETNSSRTGRPSSVSDLPDDVVH